MAKNIKFNKKSFKGWYIKQNNGENTVSLIPALHKDNKTLTASLQIITNKDAYVIDLGAVKELDFSDEPFYVNINGNIFSEYGVMLNIDDIDGKIKLKTELIFSPFITAGRDIMGFFARLPFMQCRHGIISMYHTVKGFIMLNGERYIFNNAAGYLETDGGKSFPEVYLWTQGCKETGGSPFSVMLAVARVPFLFFDFNGCICHILHNGNEYRLATYNGARILKFEKDKAVIKQGRLLFSAELIQGNGGNLKAPVKGVMKRFIKEAPCCTVRYILKYKKEVLFDLIDNNCGFEYSNAKNEQ